MPTVPVRPQHLLTVREVAVILNICKRSVWRLFDRGDLTRVRIGQRMIRIARFDVQALIDKGRSKAK